MGSWEVHTKGIGAKLLLQVFYRALTIYIVSIKLNTNKNIFTLDGF